MFMKSQAAIISLSAKSYLLNFPLEMTRKLKNIKEEYLSCFCPYNERQSASTYILQNYKNISTSLHFPPEMKTSGM